MKRIESPSKHWAGYVILHDPLNLEQVFAIEDVQDQSVDLEPSKFLKKLEEVGGTSVGVTWSSRSDKLIVPAIILCVKEWHLTDFPDTPDLSTFPATPRKDARVLVDWLWEEINKLYAGAVEVPNES